MKHQQPHFNTVGSERGVLPNAIKVITTNVENLTEIKATRYTFVLQLVSLDYSIYSQNYNTMCLNGSVNQSNNSNTNYQNNENYQQNDKKSCPTAIAPSQTPSNSSSQRHSSTNTSYNPTDINSISSSNRTQQQILPQPQQPQPIIISSRTVHILQYHAWPDFGVPECQDFAKFYQYYRENVVKTTPKTSPIVISCSAGVGRTGTFLAIDMMVDYLTGWLVENLLPIAMIGNNNKFHQSFFLQIFSNFDFFSKYLSQNLQLFQNQPNSSYRNNHPTPHNQNPTNSSNASPPSIRSHLDQYSHQPGPKTPKIPILPQSSPNLLNFPISDQNLYYNQQTASSTTGLVGMTGYQQEELFKQVLAMGFVDKSPDVTIITRIIAGLRINRPEMVQTAEQYVFVYQFIMKWYRKVIGETILKKPVE
jgi:protein tyrosine phosphatase